MNPKLQAGLRLLSLILLALTGEEALAHELGLPTIAIAALGFLSGALVTLGYGPKGQTKGTALVGLMLLSLMGCSHLPTITSTVDTMQLATSAAQDVTATLEPQDPRHSKAVQDAEAILEEVARLLGDLDRLAPVLDEIVGEQAD